MCSNNANVPSIHPFSETMSVKSHGALLPEMMATRGDARRRGR